MVAPVYATDLTDLLLEMPNTTGWTALGGGASGLVAPETDFFIQGANCISKAGWSTATKGMIYGMGAGQTIPSGKAVYMWLYFWAPNSLATTASGGLQLLIGSGSAAFKQWYVSGNENTYGGWICAVVDPTIAADATTGTPTSTLQYFGGQANVPAAGPSKGQPLGIDAFRFGRDFTCTNGDSGGYATFAGAATFNDDVSRRLGQFQAISGGYVMQGRFLMGSAGTVVDFRDSNRNILIANTTKVGAAFNAFEVVNASSNVSWTNIQIAALGTVSKGTFTATNNATIAFNTCTFTDMSTFSFLAATTATTTTFRRCGKITTGGATLTGCTIDSSTSTPAVTASSPANAALITSTKFISAGTGHGLEITGTAANMTLTSDTWSGYAASDGSTGNEAVYVNIAAGSMNLTISGGTVPSVRTAGATVTVISGAVSATVTVKDTATPPVAIQNAMVLVIAASGGPMPYQASVTITRSSSTATVAHNAHGLSTNDNVEILGADQSEYNAVHQITKIDANSYSYTVSGTPATPATGTITSTFTALSGLTDVNGQITMSRVFSSNQPITGRVRKSTSAPYYKTSDIIGTINSSTGFSTTVQLISDQ